MKSFFSVIFMNLWGFDLIIFLVAVFTGFVYYSTKNSADRLYRKLHLTVFVPDARSSSQEAEAGKLYSLFVNLTGIFPLLGILGTVISLLGMVSDMSNVQGNFYGALTSTFWGLIFSIIFKLLDGVVAAKIEDNEKNVQLFLERNSPHSIEAREIV